MVVSYIMSSLIAIYLYQQIARMVMYSLLEVCQHLREQWKYALGRDGGLSVITIGQQVMVRWRADSWAIVQKVSYCILSSLRNVVVTSTSL